MKYFFIRLILKLITFRLKIQENIPKDVNFKSYNDLNGVPLDALIKAFQVVFSRKPWFENWSKEQVEDKIRDEIGKSETPILTLMKGNSEFLVGGFSWGAILPVERIQERFKRALETTGNGFSEGDLKAINLLGTSKKILFYDEFAILKEFRGGVDPIRFLFLPGLEMAFSMGIKETIFWSTPKSKIVNLAIFMGFKPITKINTHNKEIIFLYNPDFRPVLKIAQNTGSKTVQKIMRLFSKF